MPGLRSEMMQWTDTLLDFGRVVASEVSANVKNVLCSVVGIEMLEGGAERRDNRPLYGHAGVLVRPAAPTDAGSFEIIFARVGDDMIPLASRDVRWQVDLEEGEVVVRSMSDTPARIYLKPDGSVVVEAESIKLGSADAGKHVAFTEDVESALSAMRTAYAAHKHTGVTVGTGVSGTTDAPMSDPGGLGSSKVAVE